MNDLRMKLVSERKLAALRLLGRKNVSKRLPSALRNAEGHPVEDQSCWGSLIHEHIGKKFCREDVQKPETTRALRKMKVREAQQCGQSSEELSFEEFQEVLRLVKPNFATGRDKVRGKIVRFLPGSVQTQFYCATVERLAGREDAHARGWEEFDISLVPKKGDISKLSNWRPISLVPTLYKVFEMCIWKVLDEELRPLLSQLVRFSAVDSGQRPDSVSAQVLGDCYHICGGSGERKFGASGTSVFGVHKKCFVQF